MYRASSVCSNTCNNSCFVLQEQSAVYLELCLSSTVRGWTVSECEQKWRVHWRELSLIHFTCKCYYSILLHNKTPRYSTWGLLTVCAACPTPRLNQSYELRPPWEQHLRYVPHRVRNGYNKSKELLRFVDLHPNIMIIFFFTNLMHKFLILKHLLYPSTCFEHYCAHLQEDNYNNTASGIVTVETHLFPEWRYQMLY